MIDSLITSFRFVLLRIGRHGVGVTLLLAGSLSTAMAEAPPKIDAHILSGGGGTGTAGGLSITGTIGQAIGGAASGGDYSISSGFPAATLKIILPDADESFYVWMEGLGEADRPSVDESGPLDIPARDGLTNLLKYALGLKPLVPAADAAPRVVVIAVPDDSGVERDYLGIEFIRAIEAAVGLELEFSSNLTGWGAAWFMTDVIEELPEGGLERVQLITDIPVEDNLKKFLRLRVTLP